MRENYTEYIYNDPFIKTFMIPAIMPSNDDRNYNNSIINNKFINVSEGFLRGNMENNTYVPYKNMKYIKPNLSSEKQKDLYKIQQISFAAHDANLYLDTHPNDVEMINLYNKYLKEEKKLTDLYEQKYGPLELDGNGLDMTPWSWINEPWPWNN